jgi:hypothetical protein
MIHSGDSPPDPEHTPAILKPSKMPGNFNFLRTSSPKPVRMARVMCTDGDSDEDIRSRILRPEHRNLFPIRASSTTSDRTAQISR